MSEPKEALKRDDTGDTAQSSMSTTTDDDDAELIKKAEEFYSVERLLDAARMLKAVKDQSLLEEKHKTMVRWAEKTEAGIAQLLESPDDEDSVWKKQTESHGHRDFFVYYHVTEDNELICRIDCVIESSLLIPVISVFNESDLYATWMPSWKKPIKLGIDQTKKLKESGRGNQIIQVTVNMAWPFSTREVVLHAIAVDTIDDKGAIAIQIAAETPEDDPVIPEALPGVVRIDYDSSIIIKGCTHNHPCLAKSLNKYPENEELVMLGLKQRVDAKVAGIPKNLINFVTRTVVSTMWQKMLQVAEDIRDGKRPLHEEQIAQKRELYDFIEDRVGVLIQKAKEESNRGVEANEEKAKE